MVCQPLQTLGVAPYHNQNWTQVCHPIRVVGDTLGLPVVISHFGALGAVIP